MAGCCVKLSLRAGAGEPLGANAPQSDGDAGTPQACARAFFACAEATGHKGVGGAVRFGPPPESQHQSSICCDISLVTIPF
jgi:hypothetical protein